MTRLHTWARAGLIASAATLALAGCERRPTDPPAPATASPSTTSPSTTAPPAMPPASAASQ